jgi:hypothetical protein
VTNRTDEEQEARRAEAERQEMVAKADTFPVLWQGSPFVMRELADLGCPRNVPWSLVESHEHQARRNHSHTLTTLAERGGLSPQELIAVLTDKSWKDTYRLTNTVAVSVLLRILKESV